ncbi:hypothetical protein GGF32_007718 [Allomyces javanicus]|nr:hypothetical protein GGF32_007718 [Allomyces javanicus]
MARRSPRLTTFLAAALLIVLVVASSAQAAPQVAAIPGKEAAPTTTASTSATPAPTAADPKPTNPAATAAPPAATSTAAPSPKPTSAPSNNNNSGPLPASALAKPVRGSCARRCVRKEVSAASPDEWSRYVAAIKKLNQGQGQGTTPYELLVQEHYDYASTSHGVDAFLPWHRYYLARLEQSLQKIDPNVCLLYWDWSRTSQNYKSHPVFSGTYMGSARPGCIPDGPFANWNTKQSGGKCVQREFNSATLAATQFIAGLMRESPKYTDFRTRYEAQCHAGPHVAVGGSMAVMSSPADPIFFLHHTFVDKAWADYTDLMSGGKYPEPNFAPAPWGVPASQLEKIQDWCYTYDSSPLQAETNVQKPSAIPDKFLEMNFKNVDQKVLAAIKNDTASVLGAVQDKIARNETADLVIPKRNVTEELKAIATTTALPSATETSTSEAAASSSSSGVVAAAHGDASMLALVVGAVAAMLAM